MEGVGDRGSVEEGWGFCLTEGVYQSEISWSFPDREANRR